MTWPSFESMMLQVHRDLGCIKGQMAARDKAFNQRLNRIEDRLNKDRIRWADLAPYVYGLVILGLALSGKIEWAAVAGLLFGK